MATNQTRFKFNLLSSNITSPLVMPGNFAAGATQAIKRGELIELTGNTNTEWVPHDSDFAAAGNLAIAGCEVKSGDLAGFREIIVPREGDVFEFALKSSDSQTPAIGAPVYFSSSEEVTTTAGTNVIGAIVGFGHYPYPQGHQANDASFDRGTTKQSVPGGKVLITITKAASYYAALQPEAVA